MRGLGNQGRRLRTAVVLMGMVLSILGGRLVQVQVIDDARYAAAAVEQRVRTVALPATRGDLTTRGGATLATTVKRKTIFADPWLLQRNEDPAAAAEKLAPLLEMPLGDLEARLRASDDRYVVLKENVEPRRAADITRLDITGIGTEPERKRVYPADSLAAGVLGFVDGRGEGVAGLESALNRRLDGVDGKEIVEIGLNGQRIPAASDYRRPPQPGRDVRLTIDRDLQWKAEREIAKQVRATGAAGGTVTVMDPETGQILAMASAPTYDPNDPGDAPAQHRGTPQLQDIFEPGSTAKVLTMAAALEGGLTATSPVTVPPVLDVHGETIHDAHAHGTVRMTLAGVLAKSSNIGTALAAQKVGKQALYDVMKEFGLGRPTGIAFPAATSGILPPADEWDGVQEYTIPFGQGIAVNAVQMASVYATIANGGVRVEPQLVAGTANADGAFLPAQEPDTRRVLRKKNAQRLTGMLAAAASDRGTGENAQVPGYRIAGKTGTAQRVDPDCGCYRGHNAMFSGFAPAGDPQVVVQAVVYNPQRGHYGGQVAAPVFRDVMSFALKSAEIPPSEERPRALPLRPKADGRSGRSGAP